MPVGGAAAVAAWITRTAATVPQSKIPARIRARSAASATDRGLGVLETFYSGLGDDSALVRVIIEQMEALLKRR